MVFATGSRTQIGSIAASLGKESSNQDKGFFATLFDKVLNWLGLRGGTPLQQKMARLAYLLLLIAVLLAIVVFATAKFQVDNELVLYAIALGIGVLPESLLAVLTITFALGTQRMKDQHVIVRKLDSLEALGGISDICSDKTGTITTGKMSMRQIFVADLPDAEAEYVLQSTGTQIQDKPAVTRLGSDQVYDHLPDLLAPLISAASLCSTAVVSQSAKDASTLTASGDPTEVCSSFLTLCRLCTQCDTMHCFSSGRYSGFRSSLRFQSIYVDRHRQVRILTRYRIRVRQLCQAYERCLC